MTKDERMIAGDAVPRVCPACGASHAVSLLVGGLCPSCVARNVTSGLRLVEHGFRPQGQGGLPCRRASRPRAGEHRLPHGARYRGEDHAARAGPDRD